MRTTVKLYKYTNNCLCKKKNKGEAERREHLVWNGLRWGLIVDFCVCSLSFCYFNVRSNEHWHVPSMRFIHVSQRKRLLENVSEKGACSLQKTWKCKYFYNLWSISMLFILIQRVIRLLFRRPNRSRLPTYSFLFLSSPWAGTIFLSFHSSQLGLIRSIGSSSWSLFIIIVIHYLLLARKNVTSTLDCHFLASISSNSKSFIIFCFYVFSLSLSTNVIVHWDSGEGKHLFI